MKPRWLLVMALAVAVPAHVRAQTPEETRLLRDASERESQGDFDGAVQVLRRLLQVDPSSSGGLFALERILRARGTIVGLLPAVDTFLAHDPSASGVRYMKLRVLLEVDSLQALQDEAERWFEAEPGSVVPYREVSRVYAKAFGPRRALEVLRRGRSATGDANALGMDMADLLAATGDEEGAVKEWTRAVVADSAQAPTVATRIASLPQGGREAGRNLVDALGRAKGPGPGRAAAEIAVELGLEQEALNAAREAVKGMSAGDREAFLARVAGRARDRGLSALSAWAYDELGQAATSPGQRRQLDQRLVEASLAGGDTATALEAQRRVVASFTPGSVDRRKATALAIRLEARGADAARLRARIQAFRDEFPDAPELDALAASAAATLMARDDSAGAAAVLEGVDGPRTTLERGWLLLGAGDVAMGRAALLMSLSGLEPSEATPVIQYAGLLGRLSQDGVALLARAGVLAHKGRGVDGARVLDEGADSLPEADRPAVLAEAARMAEGGGADSVAARVRDGLIGGFPEAPEVAEASLALARYRARTPEGRDEAIRLLTELVTTRPNAAVVPDARRELERLRRSGG